MKKLLVIAVLMVSFASAFAGTNTTNAGKVDANSLIDMTPIKKRHTAATVVNSESNNTTATAKQVIVTPANNMTTKGFSNNPAAIGSTGTVKVNGGVGANISTVAEQTHDADAAPTAIIVNYN